MRIPIASDLHPELLHRSFPDDIPVVPPPADLLVPAGDTASRADATSGDHVAASCASNTFARLACDKTRVADRRPSVSTGI
jgi:hypothetical protein